MSLTVGTIEARNKVATVISADTKDLLYPDDKSHQFWCTTNPDTNAEFCSASFESIDKTDSHIAQYALSNPVTRSVSSWLSNLVN